MPYSPSISNLNRWNQAATENIAECVSELRRLSARDRLVCGIRSETEQKCLLSEADLTLKRGMELA